LRTIDAAEWDALIPAGSAPLSHGYLSAWEESELSGLRSCPVVAYDQGTNRAVAACPGYFYKLDLIGVRLPAAAGVMEWVRRLWPGLLCALTYELGSPTPLTNPFFAADPSLRPQAVREMIAAALDEGWRSGAQFLLVQNFTSLKGPAADELERSGFAGVPILPTAVVDLSFDSFEDYLAAMRAQYRRRARQAMKRSEGLQIEHVTEFAEIADELARLWRLIFDRATEVKREILTPAYFRAVSRLEGSSVLLARRKNGSIAAFALMLADRPWLSFLQCGFDEEAARSQGAYFRLLYEIVRLGIEGGFDQVELGLTTLEPKLDVGAVPVPLFAWVKHRNAAIQRVLRALAKGPMRPRQLQPRRVFKEPPPSAEELLARRPLPG
jgi:predicted N-acyltransferase